MGYINAKIGNGKFEHIAGPYGLETQNENGERLIECWR